MVVVVVVASTSGGCITLFCLYIKLIFSGFRGPLYSTESASETGESRFPPYKRSRTLTSLTLPAPPPPPPPSLPPSSSPPLPTASVMQISDHGSSIVDDVGSGEVCIMLF